MKKKIIAITSVMLIIVLAIAGTALAGNVGVSKDSMGQKFASRVGEYESVEEFHAAMVEAKIEIVNEKLEEGEITQEKADEIIAHLNACEGNCELKGENPLRPENGWKLFGNGTGSSKLGKGQGNKGMEHKGTGECVGERLMPRDGTGNANRGGRNK